MDGGIEPLEVLNKGLVDGMNRVGELFKKNEMFVPEVMMSAHAMQSGVELIKKSQEKFDMPSMGTIVIGTVDGDLHDIGKNLVAMMVENAGFTVYNLGVDRSSEDFINAVKEHDACIMAMSSMLTTTMLNMKSTIEALAEAGLRDKVKVIVGGAPISEEFAKEIGADGFAPDATRASELCKELVGKN